MNTGLRRALLISGVALLLAGTACTPDESVDKGSVGREGPPRVYAVNYPLTYFAERIGGDRVAVVLPAPAAVEMSL